MTPLHLPTLHTATDMDAHTIPMDKLSPDTAELFPDPTPVDPITLEPHPIVDAEDDPEDPAAASLNAPLAASDEILGPPPASRADRSAKRQLAALVTRLEGVATRLEAKVGHHTHTNAGEWYASVAAAYEQDTADAKTAAEDIVAMDSLRRVVLVLGGVVAGLILGVMLAATAGAKAWR
jgi:hypothetical protein